eukprot:2232277-Amphidinium_carterae.1
MASGWYVVCNSGLFICVWGCACVFVCPGGSSQVGRELQKGKGQTCLHCEQNFREKFKRWCVCRPLKGNNGDQVIRSRGFAKPHEDTIFVKKMSIFGCPFVILISMNVYLRVMIISGSPEESVVPLEVPGFFLESMEDTKTTS